MIVSIVIQTPYNTTVIIEQCFDTGPKRAFYNTLRCAVARGARGRDSSVFSTADVSIAQKNVIQDESRRCRGAGTSDCSSSSQQALLSADNHHHSRGQTCSIQYSDPSSACQKFDVRLTFTFHIAAWLNVLVTIRPHCSSCYHVPRLRPREKKKE